MKRILTSDQITGTVTYFHRDPVTGQIGIETQQDVTQIVEQNKALQNETFSKSSDMWPVATIPLCILHQWALDAGLPMNSKEFGEVIKKKLNDPDNRAFRTGVFKL
jgi:hypothetical protein